MIHEVCEAPCNVCPVTSIGGLRPALHCLCPVLAKAPEFDKTVGGR